MSNRRDEILAKKAKLAELKKQRELRASSASNRQSIGTSTDVSCAPPMSSLHHNVRLPHAGANVCVSLRPPLLLPDAQTTRA